MDSLSYLPRLEKEDLIGTWDETRNACCGYLNKKAGRASTFSTGKWQKRWFVLKIQLGGHDNYALSYFHSPEEKNARQSFKLDGAKLTVTAGNNLSNSFQIICSDSSHVMIGCDTKEMMTKWIKSLEMAIRVAGERGQVQRDRWGGGKSPTTQNLLTSVRSVSEAPSQSNSGNLANNISGVSEETGVNNDDNEVDTFNPFFLSSSTSSSSPALRLDCDINTIPPGSTQRNEFEEMFRNDISRSLELPTIESVVVRNIRPAPGMDWLTVVEFDILVEIIDLGLSDYEMDELEHNDEMYVEAERQCANRRIELLGSLYDLVQDAGSALYNGFITCKVDPSFTNGLRLREVKDPDSADSHFEIFSPIPEIFHILEKYKSARVPRNIPNLSYFKINLNFEGKTRSLAVPNPLILSKNKCFIWPFEVKRAIGMMDNMQELWIEPVALVPIGLPKSLSEPVKFTPSARYDGNIVIHASKLKADLSYNVICEDNRMTILNLLSEDEKATIKETFDKYDKNGNGCIDKEELQELIRMRTAERKDIVDKQFAEILEENNSDENFLKAEETRRMQYQQLGEAQNKLLRMFENSDISGDGQINFSEFLLAEAWWLRCTINPEHASLF